MLACILSVCAGQVHASMGIETSGWTRTVRIPHLRTRRETRLCCEWPNVTFTTITYRDGVVPNMIVHDPLSWFHYPSWLSWQVCMYSLPCDVIAETTCDIRSAGRTKFTSMVHDPHLAQMNITFTHGYSPSAPNPAIPHGTFTVCADHFGQKVLKNAAHPRPR